MDLDETINERVSFLKGQINPNNNPRVNDTFQVQVEILRSVDRERVAGLILLKKKQLQSCQTVQQSDRLFSELEALEWLQRQLVRNLGARGNGMPQRL